MKPRATAVPGHSCTPETLAGALVCAAEIVAAVIAGQNAQEAWEALTAHAPAAPGWARVRDFAWSTLRDFGWGDAVLKGLSERQVPAALRPLLLVAVTEWRKGRVPYHALVHETVARAKAREPRWGGYVNALLRRLDRERERWRPEAFSADRPTERVVHWRHPAWWIDRLRDDLPNDWHAVLALGNEPPPMGLRVRRPEERPAVLAALAAAGIAAEPVTALPEAVWLPQPVPWSHLPEAVRQSAVIQDIGAQWAAHWLDPQPNERVLDACAAPGGKTLHLLDRAPSITLTAIDQSGERLAAMVRRFPELRERARLVATDAGEPARWWNGQPFDAILLDAPCSASGVVRRHPDIKWLRRPADLTAFAQAQERLLRALWSLVRPGGRLLYATCSLFRAENEAVVRHFLADHPEGKWVREKPGVAGPRILPSAQHDGFFYALLVKGR